MRQFCYANDHRDPMDHDDGVIQEVYTAPTKPSHTQLKSKEFPATILRHRFQTPRVPEHPR